MHFYSVFIQDKWKYSLSVNQCCAATQHKSTTCTMNFLIIIINKMLASCVKMLIYMRFNCNADSQPSSPPNSLSALHTTETCSVLSVITVHELARHVRGVVSVGSLVLLFRNAPKKGRSTNKMAFIEGSQPSTDGSVSLTIYAKQLNL